MLVASSSPTPVAWSAAARLDAGSAAPLAPEGLPDRLAEVPDPCDPRGVRYRLASLLAIGVCAMTAAGHNSLAAIAEWARRADPETLRRLGLPFHPLTGLCVPKTTSMQVKAHGDTRG